MPRDPIPTWWFVVVVVRLGHRFLVVHERKHGELRYLPAGRVEPGERLVDAARREVREESGVPIEIEGILRLEHSPRPDGTSRCRLVFLAHPADDTPPRQEPDEETLGAAWVTLEELERLALRGLDVPELFYAVEAGAPVYPMTMLTAER